MTEEEYFRKHYPDVCYNGKPLSPYWDLFQDGVEFGERQSEKKIEELEQKLEQTEEDLADYQFNYPTIKELEQENEELKAVERMALYSKLSDQLSKAKELLAKWVELFKPKGGNIPPTPIQVDTEHFLKADVGTKNYEEQDKILKTRLL